MGKLVKGFRPGILIHTIAGVFRNGSEPSKEQTEALKKQGYTLEKHGETLEPVTQTFSVLRAQQIEEESGKRAGSDKIAAEVASKNAATQTGENDAKTDAKADGEGKPENDQAPADTAGNGEGK